MWDPAGMLAKAVRYFERGSRHERSDDDEFALWMLLGLEFLLRVPLARVHPSLLAVPEGDSILHANGFPTGREPKSVPSHTVISRLAAVVPGFTADLQADSTFLINARNVELHTAEAALDNLAVHLWLPKLYRVVRALCQHLDLQVDDVLTEEVVEQGRALVDEQDKKLGHEVGQRIAAASAVIAGLTAEELETRRAKIRLTGTTFAQILDCPACQSTAEMLLQPLRWTRERIDGDNIVSEVACAAGYFTCDVCDLELQGVAEAVAAGLPQQFILEKVESLEDRFTEAFDDDAYGND